MKRLLLGLSIFVAVSAFAGSAEFKCVSNKSGNSQWKKTKKLATVRSLTLEFCDVDKDSSLKEQLVECRQTLEEQLEESDAFSGFEELTNRVGIPVETLKQKTKEQIIETLLSKKIVKINYEATTDSKYEIGHPDLKTATIVESFGLISEEALRKMVNDIKNQVEGEDMAPMHVDTPLGWEVAFDNSLYESADFEIEKLKYKLEIDGVPYYAVSKYAYKEAKKALKIVNAAGVNPLKAAYLDFHFWLAPGAWSADESDSRISTMDKLSKLKGDPMHSVVIDTTDMKNPTLFLVATNFFGISRVIKRAESKDGTMSVSINKSYNYRILKTKYEGQLDIQCGLNL